jgi:hypothetical protein
MFLHKLNVLAQIASKMGFEKTTSQQQVAKSQVGQTCPVARLTFCNVSACF